MTKPRIHLSFFIATLALAAALVAPGSAAAARSCAAQSAPPIHSLYVFNEARCKAGATVAERLARRFDAPSDFSGAASRSFIHQRDGQGRRWKCQWNAVGTDSDVVSWNCGRRPTSLISWIWRATA